MSYPTDGDGNEIYLPDAYLTNVDGDEFYACHSDKTPYYRMSNDGQPIFAKDTAGSEIYATIGYPKHIEEGKEVYARDQVGNEYYFQDRYAEYDDTSSLGQYYAKKADGTLFYPSGQIYAKDFYKNEKYGPGDKKSYARDSDGNEFYPREENGREIVLGDRYTKTLDGDEMYPRDEHGNETMHMGAYAKDRDGKEIFPVSHSGFVLLPVADAEKEGLTVLKIVRNMAWTSTRTEDTFRFESGVDISFIIIVLQNCFIIALIAFYFKK